jgi:hypothetical protein
VSISLTIHIRMYGRLGVAIIPDQGREKIILRRAKTAFGLPV